MILLIFLHFFVFQTQEYPALQTRSIVVCQSQTHNTLIGVNIYSLKGEKCYSSDLKGVINYLVIQNDSLQVEHTGYRLLKYSLDEIIQLDTIFLTEFGDIDLGTTGITPFIEADKFVSQCKCCTHHENRN